MDRHSITSVLEAAGFSYVQAEPDLGRDRRPDFVAWAADSAGSLVPWALVETKSTKSGSLPMSMLPQLSYYRDSIGTVEHYVVTDDGWFRADPSLRHLERVDGPSAPPYGGNGVIRDSRLAENALRLSLGKAGISGRSGAEDAVRRHLADAGSTGLHTPSGSSVRIDTAALFDASRTLLLTRDPRTAEFGIANRELADVIVSLSGDRLAGHVVGPSQGDTGLLWAAADRAAREGRDVDIAGYGASHSSLELLQQMAELAPVRLRVHASDAPRGIADLVLQVCAFGPRLNQPRGLLSGSSTRDDDVASLDQALSMLRPGGRAVLLMPSSFTFRESARAYREFLSLNYRVAALIGLRYASGAVPIGVALLVVDSAPPGDTFVGQLDEDWAAQLGPEGAALADALAHIDGVLP